MGYLQGDKPITITKLLAIHAEGEKICMLTVYDSTMSALLNHCGVETILIGDSLGNVIQGHSSTTPVTIEQMTYHTPNALLVPILMRLLSQTFHSQVMAIQCKPWNLPYC